MLFYLSSEFVACVSSHIINAQLLHGVEFDKTMPFHPLACDDSHQLSIVCRLQVARVCLLCDTSHSAFLPSKTEKNMHGLMKSFVPFSVLSRLQGFTNNSQVLYISDMDVYVHVCV